MDVTAALFAERIDTCREYLAALKELEDCDWGHEYALHKGGNKSLVEAMALIHPSHYEGRILADDVRGDRTFPPLRSSAGVRCGADVVWGYSCAETQGFAADHLFPYSLGGPTESTNRVTLCTFHNQLKGNDVHAYPWERGTPGWLDALLDRISHVLGAGE
jgi:hypothetical protein